MVRLIRPGTRKDCRSLKSPGLFGVWWLKRDIISHEPFFLFCSKKGIAGYVSIDKKGRKIKFHSFS
jgi:hypothetical protein